MYEHRYGMNASYRGTKVSGLVLIEGSVDAKSTGYATREIMSQIFASNTVARAAMPLYRGLQISSITGAFASLDGTALAAERQIGQIPTYYPQRIEQIQKLEPFGVYGMLRQYIKSESLTIVLAGDEAVIREQVRSLGLGAIRSAEPPLEGP